MMYIKNHDFIFLVSREQRRREIECLEDCVLLELKISCNDMSRLAEALAAPDGLERSAPAL